jgi:hypothetical protein
MSRTSRRKLTGSKAVDSSCRGRNKTCPWCRKCHEHKCKKQLPNVAMADALMGIFGFKRVTA